ncbi:uncharacterized protein APUU_50414S [Aspergillus puulaauensis]|uniref:Zn(2)-C6 fungal-type domain-containing protein n=1 Tax=Aspergillus puulaauensis TaxID=1220207 RepID=A0A7R8AQC7_9EURO|nr:uncharacterized protein APUU_50414S [Aspergillus puulaauensis]BCS25703.1 hypothetical protein APUU_50414S [Aspergillus puulaauensis]
MPAVSKTCRNCAESKVRCVRTPDSADTCNRCRRLGKECIYRQSGRRFKGFEKDRKIAALESKINELIVDDHSTGGRSKSSVDGDASLEDIISRNFLDIETAERYLDIFKTRMTPHFPFIVISPDLSLQELRQEKPFLCFSILAAASFENMPLQRALGHEFKKVVASRIIIGGEITFELLQGLLVFLAWSHYHSKPHRYTQFLQLAISLIIDLRLDRPPQTEMWKTALRFGPKDSVQNKTFDRPSWGSNEQRAVLGCYYLSSSIAMLVQKKSSVLRLPYHEECCKSLAEANEYPHDKYITSVIQLQFIAEKIDNLSEKHVSDLEKPGSGAELYITNINPQLQPQTQSFDYSWRDEMSVSALVSASSILNTLVHLPSTEEVGFNNTQWVQIGFALLVAYRHTVIASKPDQTFAFLDTLSKLESRVGALSTEEVDANGKRDVFFDFRRRVVQIQKWFDGPSSNNRGQESSWDQGSMCFQMPYSEPMDFDRLAGTAVHLGGPSPVPGEIRVPPDFLYSASFEEIMNEWVWK